MFSGTSPDNSLVEFVELPRDVHPYYVATQAHPELRSRPTRPHPLFAGLVERGHRAAARAAVPDRRDARCAAATRTPTPTTWTPSSARSEPRGASTASSTGRSRGRCTRSSGSGEGAAPFSVRRDVISAPDRPDERFGRLVLEHPGAVVILAVDERDRALVLHQYRHPAVDAVRRAAGRPARRRGRGPGRGRASGSCARRALLLAERWTHLFTTYSSPGLSSERIGYYLAEGLTPAPDRGGFEPAHEEADMTLHWVPVEDLLAGRLGRHGDRRADRAGRARLRAVPTLIPLPPGTSPRRRAVVPSSYTRWRLPRRRGGSH